MCKSGYAIEKFGDKYFAVFKLLDNARVLVCVTVYKKGAQEVARRLSDAHRCCCGWKAA
jgi:hypothetical protein